jgi:hypothetical protein
MATGLPGIRSRFLISSYNLLLATPFRFLAGLPRLFHADFRAVLQPDSASDHDLLAGFCAAQNLHLLGGTDADFHLVLLCD